MLDKLREIASIERVLTSGGRKNPYAGGQVIAKLVDHGGPSTMAGGGIVLEIVAKLVRVSLNSDKLVSRRGRTRQ